MLIQDVVEPRPDVLSGNFQGDLRAYRVGRERVMLHRGISLLECPVPVLRVAF